MTDPAIRTEKISRNFGHVEAVRSLDLEVPHRSIYAFLGANGAGKSTTLSILINALQPTAGRAFVLGRETTQLRAADFCRIGYVAETQELPSWMTGSQLFAFLEPFYPSWDCAFQAKLQQTLDVPMNRKVEHMSRGEQMKLRLLSSMAYRPELLILDEPFSGLDPMVREELSSGLLELVGEGDWTVILASHDVDEVERLADHVGMISNGSMRFSEPVEQLQQRYCRVSARFKRTIVAVELPVQWSSIEHSDCELRFVDDAFDGACCRSELGKLGELVDMDVRALSLKEIFIAETRRQRGKGRVS
jgi:ABC-2 type transport system ATP-binding protein